MDGTRIITLEPAVQGAAEASFEEAFGEYSELRGRMRERMRARRQKRRMQRIADKRERKLAKQEMRLEKKRRRRAMKDEGQDEPESESTVDMSLPTEEQGSESTYSDPSYQGGEEGAGEEATEPLGDSGDSNEEETSFDAETSGEVSSFDNETTSMASGLSPRQKAIRTHKTIISKELANIASIEKQLKAGKLPSNKVAHLGKSLRFHKTKLANHQDRLAELLSQSEGRPMTTRVQPKLSPKFSENKIDIPAGTSEESSSFDAKESITKHKGVLIGVGVAAVVIFALHKMKVFK